MLKGGPFSPHKDPGKKWSVFFLEEHFIVLLSLGFSRKPQQKKQQTNTEPVVEYFGDVYTKQNAYLYTAEDDLGRLFSFGYGATPQVQNSVFQGVSISIDDERSFCKGYSFRVSRLVGFLNIYIYIFLWFFIHLNMFFSTQDSCFF